MRWFCNVLSWHFACLALALLVLGITPLAVKVMADNPPPTTSVGNSILCGDCVPTPFSDDECICTGYDGGYCCIWICCNVAQSWSCNP